MQIFVPFGVVFGVLALVVFFISAARITEKRRDTTLPDFSAGRLIGKTGVVTEKIDAHDDTGAVRVEGLIWRARAAQIIEPGSCVRISALSGNTLTVERLNERLSEHEDEPNH